MGRRKNLFLAFIFMFLVSLQLGGCYYYAGPAPVVVGPAPSASAYDQVWNSAIRAAEDTNIQISSVDSGAGIIHGRRGSIDVRVVVTRLADGRTRVELDMKGDKPQTEVLASDFFAAYDRHMGRR